MLHKVGTWNQWLAPEDQISVTSKEWYNWHNQPWIVWVNPVVLDRVVCYLRGMIFSPHEYVGPVALSQLQSPLSYIDIYIHINWCLPWSTTSHRHELSAKSASFSSGFTPMTLRPSANSNISCSSCSFGNG